MRLSHIWRKIPRRLPLVLLVRSGFAFFDRVYAADCYLWYGSNDIGDTSAAADLRPLEKPPNEVIGGISHFYRKCGMYVSTDLRLSKTIMGSFVIRLERKYIEDVFRCRAYKSGSSSLTAAIGPRPMGASTEKHRDLNAHAHGVNRVIYGTDDLANCCNMLGIFSGIIDSPGMHASYYRSLVSTPLNWHGAGALETYQCEQLDTQRIREAELLEHEDVKMRGLPRLNIIEALIVFRPSDATLLGKNRGDREAYGRALLSIAGPVSNRRAPCGDEHNIETIGKRGWKSGVRRDGLLCAGKTPF